MHRVDMLEQGLLHDGPLQFLGVCHKPLGLEGIVEANLAIKYMDI